MSKDLRLVCSYCLDETPNIIESYKDGDLVCGSCGVVFRGQRIVDTNAEWRSFQDGESKSRVGKENEFNDGSLSTEISSDGLGRLQKRLINITVDGDGLKTSNKMRLLDGFKLMQNMAQKMGLEGIAVEAGKQYLQVCDNKRIFRRHGMNISAAACLVLGCRKTKCPRAINDFADFLHVKKADFGSALITINREVANIANLNSSEISSSYCNKLGLSNKTTRLVKTLCQNARNIAGLESRTPATIAGACILLATKLVGMDIKVDEIANVVKVQPSTVRRSCRFLRADAKTALGDEYSEFFAE